METSNRKYIKNIYDQSRLELAQSKRLRPAWPVDITYQASEIFEKTGDMIKTANRQASNWAHVIEINAFAIIVACLRFLEIKKSILAIWDEALAELDRARKKFPDWPDVIVYQASIIAEEAGEIIQAANDCRLHKASRDQVEIEAIQTIAMCIRFLAGRHELYERYEKAPGRLMRGQPVN
jgi:hypothetical protein